MGNDEFSMQDHLDWAQAQHGCSHPLTSIYITRSGELMCRECGEVLPEDNGSEDK